jgi:hypothetical protein
VWKARTLDRADLNKHILPTVLWPNESVTLGGLNHFTFPVAMEVSKFCTTVIARAARPRLSMQGKRMSPTASEALCRLITACQREAKTTFAVPGCPSGTAGGQHADRPLWTFSVLQSWFNDE